MKRVIVESPFAGPDYTTIARNIRYLRACLRDCLLRGEAPYASHAIYTLPGVLRDDLPHERKLGMEAGWAWVGAAGVDGVRVYTDFGISGGMQAGIDRAKDRGLPIEFRQLVDWAHTAFCRCAADAPVICAVICADCGLPTGALR